MDQDFGSLTPALQEILEYLSETEGMTIAEIAEQTGKSYSTVDQRLRTLRNNGFVTRMIPEVLNHPYLYFAASGVFDDDEDDEGIDSDVWSVLDAYAKEIRALKQQLQEMERKIEHCLLCRSTAISEDIRAILEEQS